MSALKDQQIVNLFCDILMRFNGKIDVIKEISLSGDECDRGEKGKCDNVIDKKYFMPCRDIQGNFNLDKFHENCSEIVEVIEKLMEELKGEHSFDGFAKAVDDCASKWLNYNFIIKNHHRHKHEIDNLKLLQEMVNQEQEENADNSEELNFQAKFAYYQNLHDLKQENKFQLSWLEAQAKQNEFKFNLVDEKAKVEAESFKEKKDLEGKIFQNIKIFYEVKIKELQEEVKRMTAEYEKQIDAVELRYQIATAEKKKFNSMLDTEMKIFAQREQEMKDFIMERQKKAADKKLREFQEAKAIKLQSWWRGEMVRKYKGPFKVYKARALEIQRELKLDMQKAMSAAKKSKKKKK